MLILIDQCFIIDTESVSKAKFLSTIMIDVACTEIIDYLKITC